MTQQVYAYRTLASPSDGKYSEKGSKFLASVFPLQKMTQVDGFLAQVRSHHPKARHVCYAYRFLDNGHIVEYATDDGEPAGSAGTPILNALKSHDVLNVIAIVVRYFGGTKLGIPGLIHAYRDSAAQALSIAGIKQVQRKQQYHLQMPMQLQPHALAAAKRLELETDLHGYTDRFSVRVAIPMPQHEETLLHLIQLISKREDPDLTRMLKQMDIAIENVEDTSATE